MARGKKEGSVFKDARGLWTAVVELPSYDGVTRRRKVVRSKDKSVVLRRLADMQIEKRKHGDISTRGAGTVAGWMQNYFDTIAVNNVRPKTLNNYRSLSKNYIERLIGTIKLERLTPADVRKMAKTMTNEGKSSTTARQVHRILATALKYAEEDGLVSRNVAKLVNAPKRAVTNLTALSLDEGIQVLTTALDDPYESLWFAVLLTGARQGELVGLEIDRISEVLEISWQLQRLTWQHGCDGQCGNKYGAHCPRRTVIAPADYELRNLYGGLWLTRPKSKAGWRLIPVVPYLARAIERQVIRDADIPNPHGLLWRRPDGQPIDPRDVQDLWDALLKRAGVPDVRFHDGRHTTVDLLLEAGVEEDMIEEIIGHSTRAQTRGYKTRGNRKRLAKSMAKLDALFSQLDDGHSETSASIGL